MKVSGIIGCVGDYGNPDDTGFAKMSLHGLSDQAHGDLETKLTAFHAALVTAQLTGTNKGELFTHYANEASALKPGTSCNIDRKMVVRWRTTTSSDVHRFTISGVPATSTGITLVAAGERINVTGKAALAGALETLYGLDASTVIILSGVVLQPK
jgi:hypothetical protein